MVLSNPGVEDHELYRWQLDALVSWLRCGRRGVIEAVTGSGKTDVAIAAAADALRRRRFVLVVVPSRVLMEQWHGRLTAALPDARIGRLGDSGKDSPTTCDVLVATRHSAAASKPVPPDAAGGLLIADECHGLGGRTLRRAMLPQYEERLGLTATLERSDDAVTELLLPYFGGICYRYGFEQAIDDGVCAPPRVAFVGVELSVDERAEYTETEQRLVNARVLLRAVNGMPLEPFGDFLAAVAHLAEHDAGADGRAAREYLEAFSRRREIVAQCRGKYELLGSLAPAIRDADGALVFTETVRAANHAINRLDPLVSIDLITGSTARRQRREILDDLRVRRLDAVAAPRVLDEGVDVPDANLGIVMSASRTRRQMIQRMGRMLRRKRPGVAARFVIMFATDTMEDPTNRDGTRRVPRRDRADLGGDRNLRPRTTRGTRQLSRRTWSGSRSRTRASRALRARRGGGASAKSGARWSGRRAGSGARGRECVRVPELRATEIVRTRDAKWRSAGSAPRFLHPESTRRISSSNSRRCR